MSMVNFQIIWYSLILNGQLVQFVKLLIGLILLRKNVATRRLDQLVIVKHLSGLWEIEDFVVWESFTILFWVILEDSDSLLTLTSLVVIGDIDGLEWHKVSRMVVIIHEIHLASIVHNRHDVFKSPLSLTVILVTLVFVGSISWNYDLLILIWFLPIWWEHRGVILTRIVSFTKSGLVFLLLLK